MNGAKYREILDDTEMILVSELQNAVKVHLPTEQQPEAHSEDNVCCVLRVVSGQVCECS